ncbi:MAG TPA: oligosaccharide flippase family protein [Thermoanaerobaculia bacterium]
MFPLKERVRAAIDALRTRPAGIDSPEARSQERMRRVVLTFIAALAARVLSTGALFVTTRLTFQYLGAERYGMWMTIASMGLTFLVFADLGIGNGLLNMLSDAYGRRDMTAARRAISSGTALLVAVALVIGAGFALLWPFVSWPGLFRVVTPLAAREAGPAMMIFVLTFLLNVPLGVVTRVQNGFQEGYLANIWQVVGSLGSLVAIALVIRAEGGLPLLVAAATGAPVLATAANYVHQFWVARPFLRPSPSLAETKLADQLLRVGMLFLLLQLTSAATYHSDNLIVTRLFGSSAVAQYAVANQLFSVVPVFILMMVMPLWAAYGEALSRGDIGWVLITLRRSILLCIACGVAIAVPLVLLGRPLIHWWVGRDVAPPPLLLAGMAASAILLSGGNAVAVFLNGVGWVRFQVILGLVVAVLALTLKIVFARLFGVAGIAWGTALGWALPCAYAYGILLPRRLAAMRRTTTP